MRGRALPQAALGEALLSFLSGEEVVLRFRGGLGIFKDIIPVIIHKKRSGRIVIR